jgi:peptide/nickel transport system substrate-binding protein
MRFRTLAAALMASTMMTGAAAAASLDVAIDSAPAGLDPHLITAFNSVLIVQANIYQGLTDLDAALKVVPGLAESWTVSDDGKTYTFTLKKGVTFHDGTTFDAEDAAASLRRVLSKDIASPLASRIDPIDTITVVDPQTLRVTLKAPFAPLLSSLAGIAIVPAEVEADKAALQQKPVGTGPYKFAEWQPNAFIRLEKFGAYHEAGKPKLDGIAFRFVPEAATRQVGLVSGEYDLLPGVDPATALQLGSQGGVSLQKTRDLGYSLVGMNTTRGPLADPRVRRAVNLLLNRQEIIDGALFGAGVPAGPVSPALTEWAVPTDAFACYKHDVAAAKKLLAEAGITGPVKIQMKVLPRADTRDIAQIVQQQLAAGGFEVELVNQEIGQFVQDWRNSNFDMFVSVNGGSPDPDQYFYRTFYSGGSTNVFKYDNPALNALLDKGRSTTDQKARRAVYDEVQAMLACEGPIAHLAYGTLTAGVSGKLEGFAIHPMNRLTSLATATLKN